MKVLFIADIHIKLGQKNVPRSWQTNRYRLLFDKIKVESEKVDVTVLGGDIFDRVPTLEELELYFELVKSLHSGYSIIYPGNHEMTSKYLSFFTKLKHSTELINSNVEVITEACERLGMDIIPYTEIKRFNPNDFKNEILLTHVRGEIPPHVKPEIDLGKLDRWRVVLAGDLHSYSNCQRNILYPGSPLSIGFHRTPVDNGYIIFDTDDFSHTWASFSLPQLIRETVDSEDDILATDFNHTIYELSGNDLTLNRSEDNDLIDKRISTRQSASSLDFSGHSTVAQELKLYLKAIIKLKGDDLVRTMETYDDYTIDTGME